MNEVDILGIDLGTTNSAIAIWEPDTGQARVLHQGEGDRSYAQQPKPPRFNSPKSHNTRLVPRTSPVWTIELWGWRRLSPK